MPAGMIGPHGYRLASGDRRWRPRAWVARPGLDPVRAANHRLGVGKGVVAVHGSGSSVDHALRAAGQ
jgi:hypothetical protein